MARQDEGGGAVAAACVGGHGDHLLRGDVGDEADAVRACGAGAGGGAEAHHKPAPGVEHGAFEAREGDAAGGEAEGGGVHLHLARRHGKGGGVDAGEAVALGDAATAGEGGEAEADGRQEGLRGSDDEGEARALLELRGGARVGDVRAIGADHPLSAEPTAHHGAHLAREASQDTLVDFCHSRRNFGYTYNIRPRVDTCVKGYKKCAIFRKCAPFSHPPTA